MAPGNFVLDARLYSAPSWCTTSFVNPSALYSAFSILIRLTVKTQGTYVFKDRLQNAYSVIFTLRYFYLVPEISVISFSVRNVSVSTAGTIVSLIPGLVSVSVSSSTFLDLAHFQLGCRYLSALGLGSLGHLVSRNERFSSIVFGIQK